MKQGFSWIGTLLFFTVLLAGCSASGMKDVQKSVFLHDYSQLKPGGDDQAALLYIKPGLDLKTYDKIMFDRMLVLFNENSDYWAVDPAMLKELTDYYQQALIKAVEGGYQVVDQPGPGVLWIRVAITQIKPSKPVANTMSTILPVGWVVSGATKVASGDNMGTGEAASEMEVLDSMTGERLAAAVDHVKVGKAPSAGNGMTPRRPSITGQSDFASGSMSCGNKLLEYNNQKALIHAVAVNNALVLVCRA